VLRCHLAAGGFGYYANNQQVELDLIMLENIEALALWGEFDDTSNGTIIWNAKNRWWGLAAGCKGKPQSTCTMKNLDLGGIL